MQPCEHPTCGKWIAYGSYCASHSAPTKPKPQSKRKPTLHPTTEDRAGVPAIDATEVRHTLRPRVSTPKPWTHVRGGTIALSDCIVTRPDGSTYTIPKNRRKYGERTTKPKQTTIDTREATRQRLLTIADKANHYDFNND
jgi:hypothetical protein